MIQPIVFALLIVVVAIAALTDIRYGKVYNWLTYPAMLVGVAFWTIDGAASGGASQAAGQLAQATFAMLLGLVPILVIVSIGGLGGGDAKLMGAVGALSASAACVLATMVYALVVAVLIAAAVMLRHRLFKRTFARLFTAALLVGSHVSPEIPQDSPRVAFGLAIAVGGTLAAAEHLLGLHTPWAWIGP